MGGLAGVSFEFGWPAWFFAGVFLLAAVWSGGDWSGGDWAEGDWGMRVGSASSWRAWSSRGSARVSN